MCRILYIAALNSIQSHVEEMTSDKRLKIRESEGLSLVLSYNENASEKEERHQDWSNISFSVTVRILIPLASAGDLWHSEAMLMSKKA